MIDMPLPRPRSVICSPSHIRNRHPVTSDTTPMNSNEKPGWITRFGTDSIALIAIHDWIVATPTVA